MALGSVVLTYSVITYTDVHIQTYLHESNDRTSVTEVLNTMYGNTMKKLKRLFPDVIPVNDLRKVR